MKCSDHELKCEALSNKTADFGISVRFLQTLQNQKNKYKANHNMLIYQLKVNAYSWSIIGGGTDLYVRLWLYSLDMGIPSWRNWENKLSKLYWVVNESWFVPVTPFFQNNPPRPGPSCSEPVINLTDWPAVAVLAVTVV